MNPVLVTGSAGFTDQSFRDYLRDQLRLQEWENRLVKDITVSDEEVRAYYESHRASYQSEEKILAREIVVADQALAESLRRQVLAGADFATLARDNSLELADRGGAECGEHLVAQARRRPHVFARAVRGVAVRCSGCVSPDGARARGGDGVGVRRVANLFRPRSRHELSGAMSHRSYPVAPQPDG